MARLEGNSNLRVEQSSLWNTPRTRKLQCRIFGDITPPGTTFLHNPDHVKLNAKTISIYFYSNGTTPINKTINREISFFFFSISVFLPATLHEFLITFSVDLNNYFQHSVTSALSILLMTYAVSFY